MELGAIAAVGGSPETIRAMVNMAGGHGLVSAAAVEREESSPNLKTGVRKDSWVRGERLPDGPHPLRYRPRPTAGPYSTWPGLASVISPSSNTTSPFTSVK